MLEDIKVAVREIGALSVTAQKACQRFLSLCENAGVRIFITETYRSQARQDYLYGLGRTEPGQIVTWTKSSRHTNRRAWDIACLAPQALYDKAVLEKAGRLAEGMGLVWGGNWSTPDFPHIEVPRGWKEEMMTLTEAKNILQERLGFDQNTMNYLEYYRYSEELIKRIAEAVK